MKITKDYEGLRRLENGDYVLDGNLISDEDIEIELDDRLIVQGIIESKKNIISNVSLIVKFGIEAGLGIKAGWGIEAGEGIQAGWDIIAKTYLSAGKRIFAGTSIYRTSEDSDQTIRCEELRSGEICYGELIITKK